MALARGLVLLMFMVPLACFAQMYKCVDERGVTSYSDKPRPGCKGGEVDIRPQAPISGKLQPGESDTARQDAEFRQRQTARDEAEFQENAARRHECSQMRKELNRLNFPGRVVEGKNEQGERVYLDDKVREQRLADLRERMRVCP
jgi:hypothetical protein